jgi:hypothetical protein
MPRLSIHTARLIPVALGIGALALGPGASAALSAPHPSASGVTPAPSVIALSNSPRVSYWAYPQVGAIVRAAPSVHARAVGRLRFLTADGLGQAQIYTASRQERVPKTGVLWTEWPRNLERPDRYRTPVPANPRRALLRTREAACDRQRYIRTVRVRHQRICSDAHGLARRRRRRHTRNQSATADPWRSIPRLHPPTQQRHNHPLAPA